MVGEKRRLLHRPGTVVPKAAAASTSTGASAISRRQGSPPPPPALLSTLDLIQKKVWIRWSFLAMVSWMTTSSMTTTLSLVKSFPLFALACEKRLSSPASLTWTSSGSAAVGISSLSSLSSRKTNWNMTSTVSSFERRFTTTTTNRTALANTTTGTTTNGKGTNGNGAGRIKQNTSFSEMITSAALLDNNHHGDNVIAPQNVIKGGHDHDPDNNWQSTPKQKHNDNRDRYDSTTLGRRQNDTEVPTVSSPIIPPQLQKLLQQQQKVHKSRQPRQTQSPEAQAQLLLEEYSKRKQDWMRRYTSLQSLKDTFGTNRNRFWGDLDPISARKLYKTLLPNALLELVQNYDDDGGPIEPTPEELAPLAFQARVAAKRYARYRCRLPFTIWATLFDGYRTWRAYGTFQPLGLSYEQVWSKYQKVVWEDTKKERSQLPPPPQQQQQPQQQHQHYSQEKDPLVDPMLTDADVAIRRISMKILESSCRTNERVDRWILAKKAKEQQQRQTSLAVQQQQSRRKMQNQQERQQRQLQRRQQRRQRREWDRDQQDIDRIAQTLEKDVQELLQPVISLSSSSNKNKNNKQTSSTKRSRVKSFFGKVGAALQSWTKRSISRR